MNHKKILILYTAHTMGHMRIAENIGYYLERAGYDVKLADALETQQGRSVAWFTKLHVLVNDKFPFVWKWLYTNKTFTRLTLPLRTIAARFHSTKIAQLIKEHQPDLVITTQTSPSAVVSYLKTSGRYTGKFAIAFSDYHFHPYWAYPGSDLYLVNIEEQAKALKSLGVAEQAICIAGMTLTLKPQLTTNAPRVRTALGIPEHHAIILVGSGSLGLELPHHLFASLAQQKDTTTLVLVGKNEAVFRQLQSTYKETNVKPLAFYEPMDDLYAIADLYITKPGGLSVAESLRWRIPIVVTHFLPGQEELNLEYLKKHRLILDATKKPETEIKTMITTELTTHSFRTSLNTNSHLLELLQHRQEGERVTAAVKQLLHI